MKKSIPDKVRARNGEIRPFELERIAEAIDKAASVTAGKKENARKIALTITDKVCSELTRTFKSDIVNLEDIQDIIENTLMQNGHEDVAKNYILYRKDRHDLRMAKSFMGVNDDLKMTINALEVLRKRYLRRNDQREIIETPSQMFRRVASHVANAELSFRSKYSAADIEEKFYSMMKDLEFLPNSPTLMNAGTSLGQLSACFVLPVEDSIDKIFKSLHDMAIIHQTGGGTGFDFSLLRPKGDLVASTQGEASGPVSFMTIFDQATNVIVQGGRRRGANMGILRCDHPDIMEFAVSKLTSNMLPNFNISVGATDSFMKAVKANNNFDLVNPRTNKKVKTIKARTVFDIIIDSAWRTGDPGLVFLDEISKKNTLPQLGKMQATNPCGELPLFSYESCNLASLNLSKFVIKGTLAWEKLKERVHLAIRFLDNVIEVNKYPLHEIQSTTQANRKIGLGVMGFADMLIMLGIPYNSNQAQLLARKLMRFIRLHSIEASCNLAKERGVFPNYKKSIYVKKNLRLRNATINSIAPTGTISIIAGCSSGIEPLFAVSYVRQVLSGTKLFELNHLFEDAAQKKGFASKDMYSEIARQGSLKNIKGIPDTVKNLFVTTFDISPEEHLRMQSAFQAFTDNAVSKTINLSETATPSDIAKIYLAAHRLKCKGITIYRYGSKEKQVLSFGERNERELPTEDKVTINNQNDPYCPHGSCVY